MDDMLKYWTIDGFEISTYRYHLKDRINSQHKTSGSDNTGHCVYTYNELGFRGESIKKDGFRIMSLGCSITEGVGVNDDQTWPRKFSKLIPNSVDFNFGTSGRSNDFISRCLITYYDLIKPDLVLILYTFPHRREIFTVEGNIEPYIPMHVWGYMQETSDGRHLQKCLNGIQNDNSDYINWYKNHLLIKYFLESKKCNWLWNGSIVRTNINEYNRFDADGKYGNHLVYLDKAEDGDHPGPQHHDSYANQLFDYIKKNHRDYIPTNANFTTKFI